MCWKRDKPLGGVIGLSGMQPIEEPKDIKIDVIRQTPLFLYHGESDSTLLFKNAEASYQYMFKNIYNGEHSKNLQYKSEKGLGHSLSGPEHLQLQTWLNQRLIDIDSRKEESQPAAAKEENKTQEGDQIEQELSQEKKMMQQAF